MSHKPLTTPTDLPQIRSLSQRLGTDLTLVQGSGGNTSVKNGDVLWVKASGTWLSSALEQDILVPVDLPVVQKILKSGGSNFDEATLAGTLRPSIETSLHCQLEHHIVIHVHSVNAIAWTVQQSAKKRLTELLLGIDWRYVAYEQPGVSLTRAVDRALADNYGNPELLVLENHGLVLGGDTCDSVVELLTDVESRLQITPRTVAELDISKLASSIIELDAWRLPNTPDIHSIALDSQAIKTATGGALIPDHAVFLEKQVPVCDSPDEISATLSTYRSKFDCEPDWMIVRNNGVVLSNRIGSAGEAQLRGLVMISLRISAGATIRYIDELAAADLQTWDAEIYRKKLDKNR